MNLFLCVIMILFQVPTLILGKTNKYYLDEQSRDKIVAIRYRGRNLERNAEVEVEIVASCKTCSSNYMGAIFIKDENNNLVDSFNKSSLLNGSSFWNIPLNEELTEKYSLLKIQCLIIFPNNKLDFQQETIEIEINNIEKNKISANSSLIMFRKRCPYYIEKLIDGSLIKLYETYSFSNTIQGVFDSNEIDIRNISFQYSDSSLNEIPIYYGSAYLLIDDIFKKSDIETENGRYVFPLDITCKEYKCNFSLLKNYYFDYNLDMLFTTYEANRVATNVLKLPSSYDTNKSIPYEIVIKNVGAYNDEITITGNFKVSYKLFGACENSKYCIGKTNNFSEDIEYEQTIKISS